MFVDKTVISCNASALQRKICNMFLYLIPLVIFVFQSAGFPTESGQLFEGGACQLTDGSLGICKKIMNCDSKAKEAHDGTRNVLTSTDRCGFDGFTEIVCCSKTSGSYRPVEIACMQYENTVQQPEKSPEESPDLTALLALTGQVNKISIIRGERTSLNEFPYMAALGYESDESDSPGPKYFCGGTLISHRHILTAAHCVNNIYNRIPFEARLGSNDLSKEEKFVRHVSIADIKSHPNYKRSLNYHDIAIITLNESIPFNSFIRPICLEAQPVEPERLNNRSIIVTGWGATSFEEENSPILLKTPNLTIVSKSDCKDKYEGQGKLPNGLSDGMLCIVDPDISRNSDACQGDSGGPLLLISDTVQSVAGITSFGKSCGSSVPAIYTTVHAYLDWIEKTVWPDIASFQ